MNFRVDPHEAQIVHDFEIIEKDEEVEIVVEAMGGVNPAYKFAKACLLAGRHVVTSNKALVAAHGTELLAIAREKNLNFLFEASVGGGIPLLRPLTQSLAGEKIEEISGILNGTTNYILTKMAREGQTLRKLEESAGTRICRAQSGSRRRRLRYLPQDHDSYLTGNWKRSKLRRCADRGHHKDYRY